MVAYTKRFAEIKKKLERGIFAVFKCSKTYKNYMEAISCVIRHYFYRVAFSLSNFGAEVICNRVPGLTSKQRDMCKASPDAMVAVGDGIRLATNECRHQFRHQRWNCTAISNPSSFGHVVIVGESNF